ncbi:MAG: hypothetical protein C0482_21545 [Gordonia sp.]|nr:hypothetical protein [Gordonia sp. (in: high G+C Gram-positive bacteria)]
MVTRLWRAVWLQAALVGFGIGIIAVVAWYFIAPDVDGLESTIHVPRGQDLNLKVPLLIWLTPPVFALCGGVFGWATIRFTAHLNPATRSEFLSIMTVAGCTLGGTAVLATVWLVPHDAELVDGDDGYLPDIGFTWAYLFPIMGFAIGVMFAGNIRHPDEDAELESS